MFRMMMNSKLHRATVTQADLNYVGSITIDSDLLDAAGMYPNEKVHVVNNNNGARFETYIIAGERGSGVICVNGAAARLVQKGDIVIIISYAYVSDEEAKTHTPTVLLLDEKNGIEEVIQEKPGMTV
jgi:aspartate 1-decarboxylase